MLISTNNLNALIIFISTISFFIGQVACETTNLYLTPNQSALLIPQLYIDQTIHTQYTIEGTSLTTHEALEALRKYEQTLPIALNSKGQALIRMQHTLQDVTYLYYISTDGFLRYGIVKLKAIELEFQFSLGWYARIEGMEIVTQWQILIWSARSLGVIRIQKSSEELMGNFSHTIMRVDLPSGLVLKINQCHFFSQNTYICFTNEDLIEIKQVTKFTPENNLTQTELQIQHIFFFKEELKCIVNIYRLENDLIGLCDCQQGCFNYKRLNNQFFVALHVEMINMQEILIMKLAEGGPKTVTMAVASQKILALMRWGQDQIHVVDSMLIPQLNGGQVWDIVISGDNICIKYRVQANPTIVAFQHIFIRYDTVRLQYYQLNIVLNSPYIFTFLRILYSISENNQLELRMTNPYYILVDYESASRNITIKAFNTGKGTKDPDPEPENETIKILIVSAKYGELYINKKIQTQIQINYQYTYPMELSNIFVGRAKKFIFTQQRIPLDGDHIQSESLQDKIVIDRVTEERILSINNMLQCVKLIGEGWAFRRIMSGPNDRVYIEECKSQKPDNAGDFVCQIKEIVDTLVDKAAMLALQASTSIYHSNNNNNSRVPDRNKWQLLDISIENGQIQFQLWRTIHPMNKQLELYQFLINTKNFCLRIITHKQSIKSVFDRYLLITTHKITQFENVVSVGVYDSVSEELLVEENIPVLTLMKDKLDIVMGSIININSSRITNVDYSLRYENIAYLQYDVVVGYHVGNITVGIIMQLTLSKYRTQHQCRLALTKLVNVGQLVVYLRVYSHYLYSFNQSHVSKYSLMTFSGSVLYIHPLQLMLDNPLKAVRNVGQYMLLVYTYSYRILDLERELLQLVIDQASIDEYEGKGGLGNMGVNDMIIFGSGILLVGINNIMKAYDMNIILTIGRYPIQLGRLRTYHKMTLTAVPAYKTSKSAVQFFNLTITYETSLVQIRGKAIKMLRGIPYQATNQTIIIFENMFTGPIAQYYIADIYDGAIVMLNHIEQIYDDQVHTTGTATPLAINKWLRMETTMHLTYYSHSLILRKTINTPANTPPSSTLMLYTNNTHLVLVQLSRGIIEADIQIPNWPACPQKYIEYLQYSKNQQKIFMIYSSMCIIYFKYNGNNQTSTIDVFQIQKDYGLMVLDMNIGILNGLYLGIGVFNSSQQSVGELSMGYIELDKDQHKVHRCNVTNVEYAAVVSELVIYKRRNLSNNLLCIQSILALISGNNTEQCHQFVQKIPAYYYISGMSGYYKLVIISDITVTQRVIRVLLLSKYYHAYHVELAINIKYQDPNTTQLHWDWTIVNCYASLFEHQATKFIGMYVNGTGYDYFVLQYIKLQDRPNKRTILAFYRVNYEYSLYCNYVSAWVDTNDNEVAIIVDTFDPQFYPDLPHQSIMFTTLEVFHLFKNLTFILNYNQPPKIPYTVINARNPEQANKFYSKLLYEPDPEQKYLWMYCWIGFGCVGVCLIILKVVSVMIDRGIIRWTKSLSSDEDSISSPGITVHYSNESSGGMMTEQSSYKSLQSVQDC